MVDPFNLQIVEFICFFFLPPYQIINEIHDLYIAWNVADNHWSYGCTKKSIVGEPDLNYPNFLAGDGTNLFVDILLDCDKGIMRLQLVDPKKNIYSITTMKNPFPEIKIEEMPSSKNKYHPIDNFKGYVPQFNIYNEPTKIRIARMPIQYYGCHLDNDIFDGS